MQDIEPRTSRNIKVIDRLDSLQTRVKAIREGMMQNAEDARRVRKERHDRDCVVRKFSKGEVVMTRLPGLQSKLEGAWEGPIEVLDVPSEFHAVLCIAGKKGNAIGNQLVQTIPCYAGCSSCCVGCGEQRSCRQKRVEVARRGIECTLE